MPFVSKEVVSSHHVLGETSYRQGQISHNSSADLSLSDRKISGSEWVTAARHISRALWSALGGVKKPAFAPDSTTFTRLFCLHDQACFQWARQSVPANCYSEIRSMDYLSACLGNRAAMARLAKALRALQKPGSSLLPEMRAKAALLASAWERLSHSSAKNSADPFADADSLVCQSSFSLLEIDEWSELSAVTLPSAHRKEKVPIQIAGPSIQVLSKIGDLSSKGGQDAFRRFSCLLDPVPLSVSPDPEFVWRALTSEFPWMEEANEAFSEAIALSNASRDKIFLMRHLLLLGPPGIGKTRWARRAASLAGIPFGYLPFGGMASSMALNGSERGWDSAGPSYLARHISEIGCANPIILGDEIDKAGDSRHNGNPLDALIPLLEPETAKRHFDTYLLGQLDLSWVSWILTANNIADLPHVVLTRVRIVNVGIPTSRHLHGIVRGILQDLCDKRGVPEHMMPTPDFVLAEVERSFSEKQCIRTIVGDIERIVAKKIWSPPKLKVVG